MPDGKPGRELASWAEGFFRLEFLVLLFQDKITSPAAMSGQNTLLNENTSQYPTLGHKPIVCKKATPINPRGSSIDKPQRR